jgi:hypothetical protein
MTTLKSHRRQQLMGSRKKNIGRSSLWLVYSEKLKADIPLAGDLEMLHWVSELEIDPSVRSYKHEEQVEVSVLSNGDSDFVQLEVIYLERTNGTIELHQIDATNFAVLEKTSTPVQCRKFDRSVVPAMLVHVPAARLRAFSKASFCFWLRVIAFTSQVRDYDLRHELGLVGTAVALDKEGTLRSLLESLPITDSAIAVGAICRTILQGRISVKAEPRGFGYNTRWILS